MKILLRILPFQSHSSAQRSRLTTNDMQTVEERFFDGDVLFGVCSSPDKEAGACWKMCVFVGVYLCVYVCVVVCKTRETEIFSLSLGYYRDIAEALLFVIMPPDTFHNKSLRFITRVS